MDEEGYVRSIMSELNRNLATERMTIERMVDEGIRTYKVRDGSIVEVPQDQIDLLWEVCARMGAYNLRIPIYVTTDTAGEQGSWRVDGRMESDVIAEILGKRKTRDDSVRLHFADYRELRRKIPDLVMVVFAP
ncbi:MAG: DUF61 family protein [Candidatus Methanomethylophilaceae archaeon]|nr:DUF61 family protein [Thermoplasmata archaeon]MBQ3684953.1 DUF61 family protein [Candidatus Methanomethylophilaceae archaeon]